MIRSASAAAVAFVLFTGPAPAVENDEVLLRTAEMNAPFRQAARDEWQAIREGALSSFHTPLRDLLVAKHDSEWRNLVDGISMSTSFGIPLNRLRVSDPNLGSGQQGTRSGSANALTHTISYNPISSWKASVSFTHRFTELPNQPWEGDFVYTFGYSDWRPYTFSLLYSNYGGNRIRPKRTAGERRSALNQGTLTLGWKFPIHPSVFRYLALTDESSMGCTLGMAMTPRWQGLNTQGQEHWKKKMSLGCKYTVWRNFYVSFTANWYPVRRQQQPWDADYTYGFGYFDWRPGSFTIQYNNYSGNRWPWRKSRSSRPGAFKSGGVSIGYSWKF